VILSVAAVMIFGAGVMAQMGAILAEGPDLGGSDPILLFAALRVFWSSYGSILLAASGVLLLVILGLWVFLEALFRGGFRAFWIYLGTGVARTAFLIGAGGMFLMLSIRDDSGGTFLIGTVAMLGMWHIIGILETVIRKDAVDLIATNLPTLSCVVACLQLVEGFLGFILLGSGAVVLIQASDKALAVLWCGAIVLFWLMVQSYLVAVRYSAIDIMRRDVVRG
jgi:hypothetical protein